ncbi:MAG: type II toxin-antitoxin system VapC family toxin [Bacteroidota bacterium]
MNLLLDTHAVLWFITDDPKLPENTKNLIKDGNNLVYVSIASYWELSIKYALGRLDLRESLEEIYKVIGRSDFEILQISPDHLLRTAKLQHHHRDPFDRLLIGQALTEALPILSKDGMFKKYKELEVL